jgi:hypothetical protein
MIDMSGSGISLLPHVNPSDAPIQPVQGGGGYKTMNEISGRIKSPGWHSTPLIIPVASKAKNDAASISKMKVQSYIERWKRTLGTNIPSRNVPSGDVAVVVGNLNVMECPVYVVAPLRGDLDAATDTILWANSLLKRDRDAHVVFMGPHVEGGSREDGAMIEKMLEALTASYPGHALRVGDHSMEAGSLDGLVIHAMPHTSKEIILGYVPNPDDELDNSVRNFDCLEVETIRIPSDARRRQHTGARMLTVNFSKATSIYNRDKQPRPQLIKDNRRWNAPPGWVTQISFHKRGLTVQGGGSGGIEVILNNQIYRVRDPAEAFSAWKQGSFTAGEQAMLEENNLKFTNEVYAYFLKGLADHNCSTDPSAQLSPECGIFRYLMLKSHLDGQYDKVVGARPPGKGKTTANAGTSTNAPAAPVATAAVAEPSPATPLAAAPSPVPEPSPVKKETTETATSPMTPQNDDEGETEEGKKAAEARFAKARAAAEEAKAIAGEAEAESEEEKRIIAARLAKAGTTKPAVPEGIAKVREADAKKALEKAVADGKKRVEEETKAKLKKNAEEEGKKMVQNALTRGKKRAEEDKNKTRKNPNRKAVTFK